MCVCVCVCTDAFISQVVQAEANIKINSLLSCSQKSPEGLANLLLSPAGLNFHFSNDNKVFIWNGCINAHKQPTTQTHRHTDTQTHNDITACFSISHSTVLTQCGSHSYPTLPAAFPRTRNSTVNIKPAQPNKPTQAQPHALNGTQTLF